MNNPNKLSLEERAITPVHNFGKGINCDMPKAKRAKKKLKSKFK